VPHIALLIAVRRIGRAQCSSVHSLSARSSCTDVGCNGPFFGSRGCGLGMASMQRDGFAGYRGGRLVTVPVRVTGRTLKVSVDGGAGDGVRVGIADDRERSVQACAPLRGRQTDATVTWNGTSDLSKYINGAVTLVFEIPDDAVAFAFSV
jgi:hypothetical protein